MKREIDIDKLKTFMQDYAWSIRRFSIMLWITYLHLSSTLNELWGRKLSEELYNKIINKFNEWYKVDNFTIKPTKVINRNYFYKK